MDAGGVFIGTTRTRKMRNASLLSIRLFLLSSWPLVALFGNHGLWWAFIVYVVARALTLVHRQEAAIFSSFRKSR